MSEISFLLLCITNDNECLLVIQVDHQLEQRRSCSATAVMDCIVCMFDKSSVDRLGDERPQLCILLERAVLKHMALSFSSGTHG